MHVPCEVQLLPKLLFTLDTSWELNPYRTRQRHELLQAKGGPYNHDGVPAITMGPQTHINMGTPGSRDAHIYGIATDTVQSQ